MAAHADRPVPGARRLAEVGMKTHCPEAHRLGKVLGSPPGHASCLAHAPCTASLRREYTDEEMHAWYRKGDALWDTGRPSEGTDDW